VAFITDAHTIVDVQQVFGIIKMMYSERFPLRQKCRRATVWATIIINEQASSAKIFPFWGVEIDMLSILFAVPVLVHYVYPPFLKMS
jgi:hypothetical protein